MLYLTVVKLLVVAVKRMTKEYKLNSVYLNPQGNTADQREDETTT